MIEHCTELIQSPERIKTGFWIRKHHGGLIVMEKVLQLDPD